MKVIFPLYIQIAFLVALNIAFLLLLRLFVLLGPANSGWDSLFYSPVCDRLQGISFGMHHQLKILPRASWDTSLAESGKYYGVNLYIFDSKGSQIAGKKVALPAKVLAKLKEHKLPPPPPPFFKPAPPAASPPPALPALTPSALLPPPPPNHGLIMLGPPPGKHPRPPAFVIHTDNPGRYWVGALFPLGEREFKPAYLIAETANLWSTKLTVDFQYISLVVVILFILSLLLWLPFIRGITVALAKLTDATKRIAEGDFDTVIGINRADEIGQLSSAIEKMSARLNLYVNGQKRFLGDIAHELSSPVARQQVALAILEEKSGPAEQALIADIKEEAEHMSALINELLAFSKAAVSGRENRLEKVDLNEIIDKICQKFHQECELKLSLPPNANCLGDELLLDRALGNILRNAVKYAAASGPIHIEVARENDLLLLKVTDHGPGVPEEAIAHLGEPFYRPDASRSRDAGGVGLGLAIVKTCIESCKGSFSCRNRKDGGLEIEIRLQAMD